MRRRELPRGIACILGCEVRAVLGGCRTNADVASRFLHDDTQDHPDIDTRLTSHLLDGRLDIADFRIRVMILHQLRVGLPQSIKRSPFRRVWKIRGRTCILDVWTSAAATSCGSWHATRWIAQTVGVGVGIAVTGGVAVTTWDVDCLTNLELLRCDARIGGLDGLYVGAEMLGYGAEGVSLLDLVGGGAVATGYMYGLTDLQLVRVNAWIGGLNGVHVDPKVLGD